MTELAVFDMRIAPDRIHFLKFILEGYDGLAILSTIDPHQGYVRLRYSDSAQDELRSLLLNLAPQLGGVEYL
ncbi:MAG: DUF4911 domain-containing protein [Deltaproteobacteria bacterium]|jgi:hypothetical protein